DGLFPGLILSSGGRVRFWQRAHVLANEAAARAGRGQAIAPTMDELRRVIQRSIVGARTSHRPGAHAKIVRAPLSSARLSKLVLLCYTFVAAEQLKKQCVTKEYACFILIFTNYT